MHIHFDVKIPDDPLLEEFMRNSLTNFARVEQLVRLYERETDGKKGRRHNGKLDILRSAIIFIHATLEDGMRVATRRGLPRNSREAIDKIPLVGLNQSGNTEKFSLGRLTEHMGKTVEQLIDESINNHLERISYTSTNELSGWLKMLEIDVDVVQSFFPALELMMKRRHHIVHRGDRTEKAGPGHQYARSLSAKQVREWNVVVNKFLGLVFEEIMRKENLQARPTLKKIQGPGLSS